MGICYLFQGEDWCIQQGENYEEYQGRDWGIPQGGNCEKNQG